MLFYKAEGTGRRSFIYFFNYIIIYNFTLNTFGYMIYVQKYFNYFYNYDNLNILKSRTINS